MSVYRLAPSLSGYLPVASARLALLNWLLARHAGGTVLLRLDDADPRDAGHAEAAEYDLRWLGLEWDWAQRQSDRLPRYAEAAETLKRAGRLYPCFESEDELRAKRERAARRRRPTHYDRAMLQLTPAQRAAAEAGGKRPYWRFRLSPDPVGWNDSVLGRTQVPLATVSDPVLIRADGGALPLFCSIVDDLDAGIVHVLQSEDLLTGTAMQIDIAAALNGRAPRFGHVSTLAPAGRVRLDGLTLRRLRGDGIEAGAIAAYLSEGVAPPRPLAAVAADFEPTHAAGPGRFDIAALQTLNRVVLRSLPFADVAARLPPGAPEAFWLAVRASLDLFGEVRGWWDVVAGTIVPPLLEGEGALLRLALDRLPPEPWNAAVWSDWTAALEEAAGRARTDVSAPLRLALTGEDHGPDLAALLPLIGRTRAALRLRVAAA